MNFRNLIDDFNMFMQNIENYIDTARDSIFPEERIICYQEADKLLKWLVSTVTGEAGVNQRDYSDRISTARSLINSGIRRTL